MKPTYRYFIVESGGNKFLWQKRCSDNRERCLSESLEEDCFGRWHHPKRHGFDTLISLVKYGIATEITEDEAFLEMV